jgi:hypothetical protein
MITSTSTTIKPTLAQCILNTSFLPARSGFLIAQTEQEALDTETLISTFWT